MNESSSGAVFTSMINMNSDLKSFLDLTKLTNLEEIRYENDEYSTFIIKLLERGIFYYCPTFMSRKSVIIEAGLFDQSDFISDLSIWIPIIKKFSISNILNDFAFYSNSTKQLIYSLQQNRMSPSPEFKVLDTLIMNENIPFNYSLLRYNYRKFNDTLYILFNSFRRKNIIKILYDSFRAIKIIITYFSLRLILNLTKCNHH